MRLERRRTGAGASPGPEPLDEPEVRQVHPFQARKPYLCPGCQQTIAVGLGHLVVVPRDPTLRRHWHRPCWEFRHRRRAGRP